MFGVESLSNIDFFFRHVLSGRDESAGFVSDETFDFGYEGGVHTAEAEGNETDINHDVEVCTLVELLPHVGQGCKGGGGREGLSAFSPRQNDSFAAKGTYRALNGNTMCMREATTTPSTQSFVLVASKFESG